MAKVGRPLKFKNEKELKTKIESYFKLCDKKKKPYTISGLALHLDVDTDTLRNYEKRAEFFGTVNRARQMCENFIEEGLLMNKINPSAGNFNLKNNYGWEDRTKVDNSHSVDEETINNINKALDEV